MHEKDFWKFNQIDKTIVFVKKSLKRLIFYLTANLIKNLELTVLLIFPRYRYRRIAKKSRTLTIVTKGSPTLHIVTHRYIPFHTVTHRYTSLLTFTSPLPLPLSKNFYSLLILKLQMVVYTLAGKDIYEGCAYLF